MAKTFAILASLSFLILTVICVPAKERNDPSLEIIKQEDAEEGFDYQVKESLVCEDPKTPDNTVVTVDGEPPHMSSKVRVTCDEGKHFVGSDKTEVNVGCTPLPHPCMCMAAWQTLDDFMLMYSFNCTSDRIQNEIQTKDTYEERTGREFPEEETQQELNIPYNQISITDAESETETEEFQPEEDLDGTIFEDNVDEEQSEVDVNVEVTDEHSDTNEIEVNTFTNGNELIYANDDETTNVEHDTETELPEEEEEEEESHGSNNEQKIEEVTYEEESEPEESYEINESQYDETEEVNYESEGENEMEEHAEEGVEESNDEDSEEEHIEEHNEDEEEEEYEETNEEEFETENVEEEYEGEDEEGSEESEAETEHNAWYEEGLQEYEEEEEEEEYIKRPSIIYTAIAELTKYDEDDDNKEVVDDGVSEMVEAPEELNTVQTSPVEATDDVVLTEEGYGCSLSPQSGPCKAYFRRYFFNSKTGECQLFVYGGCNGNANNFESFAECHSTCVKRRQL